MNTSERNNLPNDKETVQFLDGVCSWIQNNQPREQLLCVHRYCEMLLAKEALDDLLRQNGADTVFQIIFMPMFSSGTLSAETDSFEVTDKDAFHLALAYADNFEIVPLANGQLRLAFVFYNMMHAIV